MYLNSFYFKAPLFHYKSLLVHNSSIGSLESLSDRTSSFKINFKYLLTDLDTPNIRGLNLKGFIDGSQNAVWRSEMLSASLQKLIMQDGY